MKQPQTLQKIEGRKKATVSDLAVEIDMMKCDNTLQHAQMRERMDRLQEGLDENKAWFNSRLDKLDSRIWWIMALTVTTLLVPLVEKML